VIESVFSVFVCLADCISSYPGVTIVPRLSQSDQFFRTSRVYRHCLVEVFLRTAHLHSDSEALHCLIAARTHDVNAKYLPENQRELERVNVQTEVKWGQSYRLMSENQRESDRVNVLTEFKWGQSYRVLSENHGVRI